MSNEMKTLLGIVASVKDTLIDTWKTSGAFIDKNNMKEEGVLAESIGLTGLLLLTIAFKDEPDVIAHNNIDDIKEIVENSLSKIWSSIQNNGYSVDPLIDIENSAKIFTKDNGYTDTITWILSICMLAHFAEKEGVIAFNKDTQSIIIEAAADTLKRLLESQHDNGTWGFQANKGSISSLFFTYSAGSTIADIYDYIFGEIFDDADKHIDHEFAQILSERIGVKNIKKELDASRKKLAQWLLECCLPLLPKLSNCENMTDEELETLGIWKQTMSDNYRNKNYYNLYYVYYLIDLMITSSADQQYLEIVKKSTDFVSLKKLYQEKQDFTQEEFRYFFRREENNNDLCINYIEQAIHSSRNHFLNALRTGNDFWDNTDSELQISWRHSDVDFDDDIKGVLKRAKVTITEPALVPMALRANINYTYYISKRADVTVDNLFRIVINERDSKGIKDSVAGLWDSISYNLSITERSIEALVDYYDYLCEFGTPTFIDDEVAVSKIEAEEKSEVEKAIEKVVKEYLLSEDAITIIKNALALSDTGTIPVKGIISNTILSENNVVDIIDELLEKVKSLNDSFKATLSSDQLGQLFEQLQEYSMKNKIGIALMSNDDIDQNKIDQITVRIYDAFNKSSKFLLERIYNDIQKNDGIDFVSMYSDIIRPSKK